MPKLIVMRGLPASGKSTYARAYVKTNPNAVRINRDRVVDAWRDLGLKALQVHYGDF